MTTSSQSLTLDLPLADSLKLLQEHAKLWGGEWEGDGPTSGRLGIPVLAGIRQGFVGYAVELDAQKHQTHLRFVEKESDLRVHRPTFVVLLMAAVACLTTLVVPFVPRLLPLLAPAVVIALATWLFIMARLRNSGIGEFLIDLSTEAEAPPA